ncbi:nucleoside triphosphate pyrophosphohydrolase [Candidatus Margulisiibacteriota bacterium]
MKKFDEMVKIVAKLRQECPWDQAQTFETLKPFLVEEVYEAIQAIDDKDKDKLAEELGDMLLHVVMLAIIINENTKHSMKSIIEGITKKMVRRHPHVFGRKKLKTAEDVLAKWEKSKLKEIKDKAIKHKGILASIPRSLPALYRAEKVQKRAARVGFDWDKVAGAWEKVHEEMDEIKSEILNPKSETISKSKNRKIKEEIGDLLFAVANVARKLDIHAEEALQDANSKFMRRFSKIEKKLGKKKMTLAQMDALWDKVKSAER